MLRVSPLSAIITLILMTLITPLVVIAEPFSTRGVSSEDDQLWLSAVDQS